MPSRRSLQLLKRFLFLVFLVILVLLFSNETTNYQPIYNLQNIKIEARNLSNLFSFGFDEEAAPSYQFFNQRLRLWYEGRCVDATDDGKLIVTFCDPDKVQTFSLTTSKRLVYERLGLCVDFGDSGEETVPLELVDCAEVDSPFLLENDGGTFLQQVVKDRELCLTPTSIINNTQPTLHPCLNDPVRLAKCDREKSKLVLLEESFFQYDRRLLKNAVIQPGSKCDFKACGFNKAEPVKFLSPVPEETRCSNLSDCVTVVSKTTRRPHLILRLARSVREILGYDLHFVVYDDGPDDLTDEMRQKISEFPLMRYIVSMNEDLGIGNGRDLAIFQVKTKYLFLLDDDMLITRNTDLKKLVRLLDVTDVSVAAACDGHTKCGFSGILQFGYFSETRSRRRLGQFKGLETCETVHGPIPEFPNCYRCDITSNIFLARTDHILEIGGWDPELMIVEHRDFYIRLKAAGMKMVVCSDVTVRHARPARGTVNQGEGFVEKRRRGGSRFKSLIMNRWNVQNVFEMYGKGLKTNEDGELVYTVSDRGHC